MSAKGISDELVRQVTEELRERYALDDDDVRELGSRLADDQRAARQSHNRAFAETFTDEHRETFDRLAE